MPLLVSITLTLILIFLVGESWPRHIAPGSGLNLVGLGATAFTSFLAWEIAICGVSDVSSKSGSAASDDRWADGVADIVSLFPAKHQWL